MRAGSQEGVTVLQNGTSTENWARAGFRTERTGFSVLSMEGKNSPDLDDWEERLESDKLSSDSTALIDIEQGEKQHRDL
ncbi:hypothetical protein BLNAU_11057 [Blattamonas nauphoetae]|uniref:Uncharacterized protein n=1 Tax=Blattamonas nauphoetae TaxID=2049346 RepID=A0ABQ9XRJ1_9EUKA|nr:hypothetical protein BLNAU_11057 [Blattamonas nauphoetae]